MIYPKEVMSKAELHKMGFSMEYLNEIVHHQLAPTFCWKKKKGVRNSKYFFDTTKFEKLREKGAI
ncbi:MAG: hypothetical protein IJA27_07385 [Lachnospiraceae bacterium]|nr:hypothetical protein [Lachnospiraceae bacterium]